MPSTPPPPAAALWCAPGTDGHTLVMEGLTTVHTVKELVTQMCDGAFPSLHGCDEAMEKLLSIMGVTDTVKDTRGFPPTMQLLRYCYACTTRVPVMVATTMAFAMTTASGTSATVSAAAVIDLIEVCEWWYITFVLDGDKKRHQLTRYLYNKDKVMVPMSFFAESFARDQVSALAWSATMQAR